MLVYNLNSNVSVRIFESYEPALACEDVGFLDSLVPYCSVYDCASCIGNSGGIVCSCTSDGQLLDPERLADPPEDCKNSPQIALPLGSEFTMGVVAKSLKPTTLRVMFANSPDSKRLEWNLTAVSTNGSTELPLAH